MNVTLSIDDEIIRKARRRAESTGSSVNQVIRDYLAQYSGATNPSADAAEFERLSNPPRGNSRAWKFNHEEIHSRSSTPMMATRRRSKPLPSN